MRFLFLIALTLTVNLANAQIVNYGASSHYETIKQSYQYNNNELTAFKKKFLPDSDTLPSLVNFKPGKGNLRLNPAFDLSLGYQNQEDRVVSTVGLGIDAKWERNKWNGGLTFLSVNSNYMNYQRGFINRNEVVPGMNVARGDDRFTSENLSAFINFKPNSVFDFELGYGKNFIGDGYRSLLLSDAANSSPYLKINTRFWKVQYTNLFAAHQNIYGVGGKPDLYQKKYTATHFLDYKVTKWFSIGLFETIVWQAEESNYNRGFDPNYANPFIFYRPVEFSVGSSDNALVGTNLKLTPFENHIFYSQFIFDEFLLSELKADLDQFANPEEDIRSGWWANKYGVQFGWKTFDFLNIPNLQTLVEFNLVRPYTYAHSAVTQAYTNYNISLAHPLGANFHEFVSFVNYRKNKWRFRIQYNQSRKGYSFGGGNFGGNLQLSNATRIQEYENTLTQGLAVTTRHAESTVSYTIKEAWNANLIIGYIWHEESSSMNTAVNNMIFLRFKTNLYNQYWDY